MDFGGGKVMNALAENLGCFPPCSLVFAFPSEAEEKPNCGVFVHPLLDFPARYSRTAGERKEK
jgi:hypothetical protein